MELFLINTNSTKEFIKEGAAQAYTFLVIAEILAITLRNNEDIEGITVQDIRNLLNQFADDMDIFSLCYAKEAQLATIYEELERFRLQSGFTVSYEKTTLYRIGSLRHSNAQLYDLDQFKWSNEDINVLGITIAHEDLVEKNYTPIIDKARKTLHRHGRIGGLSLLGKVQVVNTLIASLFVYRMMVMPKIPQISTLKTMDNMIRDYIWNGKKAKIAYNILQNPKGPRRSKLDKPKEKGYSLKSNLATNTILRRRIQLN